MGRRTERDSQGWGLPAAGWTGTPRPQWEEARGRALQLLFRPSLPFPARAAPWPSSLWGPSPHVLPRQAPQGQAESPPEGQTGAIQGHTVQGACGNRPLPPGAAPAAYAS